MNRMICLALALCLMLCACAGAPAQTTAPPETESPAETTTPSADNDMSYQEQDMPIADDPAETEFQAYTHRIEDPDTLIYAGPGFLSGSVELVGEAGARQWRRLFRPRRGAHPPLHRGRHGHDRPGGLWQPLDFPTGPGGPGRGRDSRAPLP